MLRQILILMQLFDPRGTGQVEYMEVVAWLDPNAVVEVNKQCANTLTKLTYGSQKDKALQDRKPPSEGYMKVRVVEFRRSNCFELRVNRIEIHSGNHGES